MAIFITEKNKNEKGVPVRNLFNSLNANKKIKEYVREYYNEYYIEYKDYEEEAESIDWTHIIIEDLKIFFEVKNFRKSKKLSKTYFNSTKKNQNISAPLLTIEEYNEKETVKKIKDELKRKGIAPTKNKVNEKLSLIKKEFENRNAETVVKAKKYFKNLIYLLYGIRDSKEVRFKQPVLKRVYIMTPFNGMKRLSQFESNGIKIPADILAKYIINDYEGSLRKQIAELKQQIKESGLKKSFFGKNVGEEEIENLKALVAELESRLDKENEESRKAKITNLLETHKFEETYLISLWEYGMNLVNLPTGRLSIIKKENLVLWYALTSLGRPFSFKAGVPIEVMRQIEIEKYKTINRLKEKFEDPDKTARDFVSPETIEELRENSLDFDDYMDDEEEII